MNHQNSLLYNHQCQDQDLCGLLTVYSQSASECPYHCQQSCQQLWPAFFFFLINRFCHWFDAKHSTDLTESCVSKPYPLQKKFLTIFTSDVPGKGNNSSNAQHSIEWDYQETFCRVGLYNSVRFNRNNMFDKLLFKDVSGWPSVFWWNVFQQAPGE